MEKASIGLASGSESWGSEEEQKQLAIDTVLELAFVLSAVEMAFGFCDEPVVD